MPILIALAIGLGAGVMSGLFGIGGGIVIVPLLVMVAGLTQVKATGTSLASLLLPVGALGAWRYYTAGNVDVRGALFIAIGLFFGAYVGAVFANDLSPLALRRAFAVFLVLVAAKMWLTR
jgi:uncharacterized membrane protein YfcA